MYGVFLVGGLVFLVPSQASDKQKSKDFAFVVFLEF